MKVSMIKAAGAVFGAASLALLAGCGGGGGTVTPSSSGTTGTVTVPTGTTPTAAPGITLTPGANVAAVQQGGNMYVAVAWPGATGRLIGSETRRIDMSITGTGIATPPTASLVFPETEVEMAAPAGPNRFFRFTEFDANGNLVKQSYAEIGTITAAGSAWVNNNQGSIQYGPFYLTDQYFAGNKEAGAAAANLPTDGSTSQLQTLDLLHSIVSSTVSGSPLYDAEDWYYFTVPSGPRQFVSITMNDIQQATEPTAGPAMLELAVTPDGQKYVAGDNANAITSIGFPVGAADVVVDGVQSQGSANKELAMGVAFNPVVNISQHVVEALLPQGTYFVRVCFVGSPSGLTANASAAPSAEPLDANKFPSAIPLALQVGYRLSVAFGQLSGTGGVSN